MEPEIRAIIRTRLNADKVKLWLEPYTTSDGQKGEALNKLIESYSSTLQLQQEVVETVIEDLRHRALFKFSAIQKFKETGIATLTIRFTEKPLNNVQWNESEQTVEISLESSGLNLKDKISEISGLSSRMLKPIANGHVIDDNLSLQEQQIKNFTEVLVLCMSAGEIQAIESELHSACVAKTREAAQILSEYDADDGDDSMYQLHIADQTGKIMNIPKDERKALMLAMMLHEKGRAALKRKDISLSLVYLLEADKEFRKCCSSILDFSSIVDNYALVCLDIVWCYLRLQSVSSLPDAEMRLSKCEESFKKSYGQNLERLASVKGGTGKEQAVLVRLHLLQAVLAFHQRNNQLCMRKLQQVESELSKLQVDKNSMTQVMEMGFSPLEARLGLRASGGNVTMALARIIEEREEKKNRLEKEKKERQMKRLERKLGKTANGENVNVNAYEMLLSMGFAKGASAMALRQTNNDIHLAVEVINNHPEFLSLPDPDPTPINVTEDMIQQVMALGFDEESVVAALHHFGADISRAVEQLVQLNGVALPEWYQSVLQSLNSSSSNDSLASPVKDLMKENINKDRVKLIEEEILPDVPRDEEDHLDLELDEEAAILEEYKARLASVL